MTIKAKAAKLNIVIEQNASFATTLFWTDKDGTPIDLTGYSALLEAKDAAGVVVLSWSSGAEITLGTTDGSIAIAIDDSVTATYTFDTLTYCLKMIDPLSFGTRLLKGTITLDAEC